jgi:hypothetical protein
LRQRGSCESCRGNSGDANQCEFHLGLHHRSSSSHDIFLSMARAISDHFLGQATYGRPAPNR